MKIQIQPKNKLPIADCRLPIFSGSARNGFSIGNRKSKIGNLSAFTLTEIMLVVVIIGILAALVIPRIAGSSERARITATYTDINGGIKSAIGNYEVDNGSYPKNLNDLVVQPSNVKNWHGPYLEKLPVDQWGNPYLYYFPGKHNASSYDLLSAGPDGKEGTDDDLGNWTK